MNYPKVGVVVPTWNNYDDTSECLHSLQNIEYPRFEIIVVDNASEDNSLVRLKSSFPGVRFVGSTQNLGYAGGLNKGISVALQNKCLYVLALNNDTVVSPDFLTPLVEFGEANEATGICGGKIFFFDEPNRIWTLGGHVSILRAGGQYLGSGQIDEGQYDEIAEISLVSGCMMLIKAKVLHRVGHFNESYFFRGEEWEFCWRAKKAGFKLHYIPQSRIWHKENRSHNRFDPQYIYSAYVAKQMFAKQCMPVIFARIWRAGFYLYAKLIAVKKFQKIASRRGESVDKVRLKMAIKLALKDGATKTGITEHDLEWCQKSINIA